MRCHEFHSLCTRASRCTAIVPLILPYCISMLVSCKGFSKERTALSECRAELRPTNAENHVKTVHKAAAILRRREMQFRPLRFIEAKVYFTCCFFLRVCVCVCVYRDLLLHLETPLIIEMQASSHMRKEKEKPIMETAC